MSWEITTNCKTPGLLGSGRLSFILTENKQQNKGVDMCVLHNKGVFLRQLKEVHTACILSFKSLIYEL